MKFTFPLYHWSPVSRRKSILRYGLRPRMLSRSREWRPPYVCFCTTPWLAWRLSASMSNKSARWDLWMVWWDFEGKHRTYRPTPDRGRYSTEYRIYGRISKRHLWRVGTRTRKP